MYDSTNVPSVEISILTGLGKVDKKTMVKVLSAVRTASDANNALELIFMVVGLVDESVNIKV